MLPPRFRQPGFTLIELMITIVILAIVITVGVPGLADFIASQRVRTTASDLIADMAFARAEAIKESRPVIFERVAGATSTWKDGWRICVAANSTVTNCDSAEIRKQSSPVPGRTKVCATTSNLNDRLFFHPDGRARLSSGSLGNSDGIKVSDDNGDSTTANDRIRLVFLGLSGRARMEVQDNDPDHPTRGTACP
jgi:type IV fimbrial biogenesis protein FimT